MELSTGRDSCIKGMLADIFSPRIIPIFFTSVVLGILIIILDVSFAAMIFSGELAPLAIRAVGLTLAGTFFICLISAFSSSFKGIVAKAQDAPTAVLSAMAVSVVASSGVESSPEIKFMTIAAILFLSSVVTGLFFLGVGKFRLANLLRFMPYPVVGGFLAGTGWLLSKGSIGIMCDVSLSMNNLPLLTTPENLMKWLPGVIYGVALFWVLLKRSHFLILPGSLVAGTLVFYAVMALFGRTIQEAKTAGFLVSGVPTGGLWPAFTLADLALVQWQTVFQQLPAVFTVALVSMISMLLNMSGIELASRSEMDMNKGLMVVGSANIVAGFFGAVPGYPSISLSLLGYKAGANSRITGIVSAMIVGAVLFFGGTVLEYFPKSILGGLVLLLGLFFIYDWIIIPRKRIPRTDWLIVIAIFLVIGIFGFMQGVAFGLVASIIFFVFQFSRVPVVKPGFTALERRSMTVRPVPHQHILRAEAAKICGYELTGYLFFGSASSLMDTLKNTLASEPAPLFMILDLAQMTGFDISAVNNFQRIVFRAKTAEATIVITTAPKLFTETVRWHVPEDAMGNIRFFPSLNDGLAWCEDCLIDQAEDNMRETVDLRDKLFESSADDVMSQLELQEYFEVLCDRIEPWLAPVEYSHGSVIVEKGTVIDGLHLLSRGHAVELDPESGVRICFLEPGCVIAGPAAFTPDYICPATVMAESNCTTAYLSMEARKRFEEENPSLAIEVYGYLFRSKAGKPHI